jgi:hypothetical protein
VNDGDLVVIKREHGEGFHYVLVGPGGAFCTCPGFERWGHCWAADEVWGLREMTSRAITVQNQAVVAITPNDLRTLTVLAGQLIEAGSVAVPENLKNQGEVLAVMLAGLENGVQPMTSLRHIAVVNGKTEPDAQLMVAICMTKEDDIRFEVMREDGSETTVRLTRPSKGYVKEFTYTNQMAADAGLLNKGAWQGHKSVMRQWAGFKRLARAYCADLINGVMKPIQAPDQDDPDNLPRPAGVQPPPHDPELGAPDAIEGDYRYAPVDLDPGYTADDVAQETRQADEAAADALAERNEAREVPGVKNNAGPRVGAPDVVEPVIDVALADDEQLSVIGDYHAALEGRHGAEALTRFQDAAAGKWPYAAQEDDRRFRASRLTASDASAYIAWLRAAADSRDGTPPDSTAGLL